MTKAPSELTMKASPSALTISGPPMVKALHAYSFAGTEALSDLFEYQLEVVSEVEQIDLKALLGESMTLHLPIEGRPARSFNGLVVAASRLGRRGRFASFRLTLAPHLWLLTRTRDCRIFQGKTVPDVATRIFRAYGLTFDDRLLTQQYRKWDYLTQYNESDYAFVRRILAHEGIYFYFRHQSGAHDVVLADAESAHKTVPGFELVPLVQPLEKREVPDYLSDWTAMHAMQTSGVTLGDYEFRLRGGAALLQASRRVEAPKTTTHEEDASRAFTHYCYPGHSTQAENAAEADAGVASEEGERLARVRLDEQHWRQETFSSEGTARGLATGHRFGLRNAHPGEQFIVISTTISLRNSLFESGDDAAEERCRIRLQAIGSKTPFRPQRQPKPTMPGPQTARVVGPDGHEIWTDKFGRVRIQLHWDREGDYDENSACWVRVAQPWAGNRWGAVFNPRIGNEVVVDFLDGDPDRPIITGSVYNADNMPPYSLPANQTQGGVKTRSSKGGNSDNFNELRFEDKKGEEQVYIQAEKDLDIVVKNDESREVCHDRNKVVGNDESTRVDRNRSEAVGGNETIKIGGSRAEEVGKHESIRIAGSRAEAVSGDEEISIRGGRSESVGKDETVTIEGHRAVEVNKDESLAVGGSRNWSVEKDESGTVQGERVVAIGKGDTLRVGGAWVIDAGDHVVIKSGAASLTLSANGDITLKGKNLFLEGGGRINVKASGELAMTGANIKEN